jgi:hypothetical protein
MIPSNRNGVAEKVVREADKSISFCRNRELRLVKALRELHPFHFLMAWHPRLNTDRGHVWLREAMRS